MDTALFDYHLPVDRIAQRPADRRDQSRLMLLDRASGAINDHLFAELPTLLRPGDLVVTNDTRVLPARLALRRLTGSQIEGLFVRAGDDGSWEMMIRGRGRIHAGEAVAVDGADGQTLVLEELRGEGLWRVRPQPAADPRELLARVGRAPLPPYIQRKKVDPQLDAEDRQRYQTVFAEQPGAVAAPTAGLHFTPELIAELKRRDIQTASLTLHVGLGTFKPVTAARVEEHRMHSERYFVSAAAAANIRHARAEGRRIVAVGTTVVRVLETLGAMRAPLHETEGETDIFIYPPFEFRVVGAMITNFHLPKSSLLMLVSAFAGREFILRAYHEAIARSYRFYSYGDACLIE
jgi:S-adenosylmethionine:tRNA ribosyltransferase-isomerase